MDNLNNTAIQCQSSSHSPEPTMSQVSQKPGAKSCITAHQAQPQARAKQMRTQHTCIKATTSRRRCSTTRSHAIATLTQGFSQHPLSTDATSRAQEYGEDRPNRASTQYHDDLHSQSILSKQQAPTHPLHPICEGSATHNQNQSSNGEGGGASRVLGANLLHGTQQTGSSPLRVKWEHRAPKHQQASLTTSTK